MTILPNFASYPRPRILILYGSPRRGSYSRLFAHEANRALADLGAETHVFDPDGLPIDCYDTEHPKVAELDGLVRWCTGFVWCAPEHHGSMSAVMKLIIDHLPAGTETSSPTRGKPVSLMQISGGSLSGNALNDMQRVARSLGMYPTSRQVSVANVSREFKDGAMQSAQLGDRLTDAMDELVKLSLILAAHVSWLNDIPSARRLAGAA